MRYNYPKNRIDLEGIVLQQMEYIQWGEFTKFRTLKMSFMFAICRVNSIIWTHTKEMAVRLDNTLFSWRWECEAVRYLGKILPENISDLPGGSSNILSSLRCPSRMPWKPMPVQFVYWLLCMMTLSEFLNINIESMRDQSESKDWECITKMLSCGSLEDDLILFMLDIHSLQRVTTIVDEVFTNYGLCINGSKTETMILNHMVLEDEYPDTVISLCNIPLTLLSLNTLAHISPKRNLTRKTLKLITVSKLHTQNLLQWPTFFKTLRFTLKSELRLWIVSSKADSRTHARIGI